MTDATADLSQVSDGYHTFEELYASRHLLLALAAKLSHGDRKLRGWKSWNHSDETPMYDGYFIVGLDLPTGQISYHLPAEMWTLFQLPHYDRPPAWDGHTAAQVLERIEAYLKS